MVLIHEAHEGARSAGHNREDRDDREALLFILHPFISAPLR